MEKRKSGEAEVFYCPLRAARRQASESLKVLFSAADKSAGLQPLAMPPLREASRQARESLAPLMRVTK